MTSILIVGTNNNTKPHFDSRKNAENIEKHGISFEDIYDFEWDTAITKQDRRFDYGEMRFITYGMLRGRLHVLVWTPRDDKVRPISFRKANARERDQYEEDC